MHENQLVQCLVQGKCSTAIFILILITIISSPKDPNLVLSPKYSQEFGLVRDLSDHCETWWTTRLLGQGDWCEQPQKLRISYAL